MASFEKEPSWKQILSILTIKLLEHLILPEYSTTGLLSLCGNFPGYSFELHDPEKLCNKLGDVVIDPPQEPFVLTSLPLVYIQHPVPTREINSARIKTHPWEYSNFDKFVNTHPEAIEHLLITRLGIKLPDGKTLKDYKSQLEDLVSNPFSKDEFRAIFA
jgi:hypothetical protein